MNSKIFLLSAQTKWSCKSFIWSYPSISLNKGKTVYIARGTGTGTNTTISVHTIYQSRSRFGSVRLKSSSLIPVVIMVNSGLTHNLCHNSLVLKIVRRPQALRAMGTIALAYSTQSAWIHTYNNNMQHVTSQHQFSIWMQITIIVICWICFIHIYSWFSTAIHECIHT